MLNEILIQLIEILNKTELRSSDWKMYFRLTSIAQISLFIYRLLLGL